MAIGKCKWKKKPYVLGVTIIVSMLMAGGMVSCKKGEEAATQQGAAVTEGNIAFEGTVKVVVGKYIFIPEVRGFDLVVQGSLDLEDTSALIGKEVKGEGQFSPERPSVLIAETLEIKEESGNYRNVFTRTEEASLDDYLDLGMRDQFEVLEKLSYDKKDGWEGKERVKIQGRLEQEEDSYKIVVFDDKGNQAGKIIVDDQTDFAQFYLQKLNLFDKFWFYLTVKDTIEWRTRRQSREMFHADVLFAGLF
jgi:hypothetical protein